MTVQRDPDTILAAWLEEGPDRLPDSTRRSIAVTTRTTHQTRRPVWVPPRFLTMNGTSRLALAALAVVAVAVGGLWFFNRTPADPGVGGPQPSLSPSPSPTATPEPSPTPDLLDTATWTRYVSDRYGFSIAYPAFWVADSSDHVWTMATDGTDWLNTGAEVFVDTTPDQGIRVSAWSVAVEPGTTIETWLETYCTASGNSACTDFAASLVAVSMDGHPGLRPTQYGDTQAFFLIDDRIYGVTIWRTDDDPSVAKFGGAIRLLDALLSTMQLLPEGPAPAAATTPAPS